MLFRRPERRDPTRAERFVDGLDDDAVTRLGMRFTGFVQGVGFRYTQLNVATKLGVTGWVRNMDDGSVTSAWQGTGASLKAMVAEIRAYYGKYGAAFSIVSAEPAPLEEESSFEVRI